MGDIIELFKHFKTFRGFNRTSKAKGYVSLRQRNEKNSNLARNSKICNGQKSILRTNSELYENTERVEGRLIHTSNMSRNTIVLNMDKSKIQEAKKELKQEQSTSFTRRGHKICSHNILGGTLRHLCRRQTYSRQTQSGSAK